MLNELRPICTSAQLVSRGQVTKFAAGKGLKIKIEVEVSQADGISEQKVEETKVALRELGLGDDVEVQ